MNIYLMKQHKSQKIFLLYAVHQLQSSHSVEWRIDIRYLYYYQQLIDSQHKWCIKLLRWKKQRALNNYLEFKHGNVYIYMIHIHDTYIQLHPFLKKKSFVCLLSTANATEDSRETEKEFTLDEDNQSKSSLELDLPLQQINKCYVLIYNSRIMKTASK